MKRTLVTTLSHISHVSTFSNLENDWKRRRRRFDRVPKVPEPTSASLLANNTIWENPPSRTYNLTINWDRAIPQTPSAISRWLCLPQNIRNIAHNLRLCVCVVLLLVPEISRRPSATRSLADSLAECSRRFRSQLQRNLSVARNFSSVQVSLRRWRVFEIPYSTNWKITEI